MDYNVLVGIVDGFQDTVPMAGFFQRTHRADDHALAAIGAGGVANGQTKRRSDDSLESTVLCRENRRGLHFVANTDATATKNTLIGVTGDRLTDIDGAQITLPFIRGILYTQLPAQSLELTVLVPGAGQALLIVVREQQLIHSFACFLDLGIVSINDHAIPGLHHTGSLEILSRRANLLYHTDAAGTILMDAL